MENAWADGVRFGYWISELAGWIVLEREIWCEKKKGNVEGIVNRCWRSSSAFVIVNESHT